MYGENLLVCLFTWLVPLVFVATVRLFILAIFDIACMELVLLKHFCISIIVCFFNLKIFYYCTTTSIPFCILIFLKYILFLWFFNYFFYIYKMQNVAALYLVFNLLIIFTKSPPHPQNYTVKQFWTTIKSVVLYFHEFDQY